LATGQGEPSLPGQRGRAGAPARAEPPVSATPASAGAGGDVSWRVGGARGSAPSAARGVFWRADVWSTGLLCLVHGAARAFEPAFL